LWNPSQTINFFLHVDVKMMEIHQNVSISIVTVFLKLIFV
jgi:hypothetical protein